MASLETCVQLLLYVVTPALLSLHLTLSYPSYLYRSAQTALVRKCPYYRLRRILLTSLLLVEQLCLPYFDSPSVFARILDKDKGGHWSICLTEPFTSKQAYLPSSNVRPLPTFDISRTHPHPTLDPRHKVGLNLTLLWTSPSSSYRTGLGSMLVILRVLSQVSLTARASGRQYS